MIRIVKITEKYQDLILEDGPVQPTEETTPAQGTEEPSNTEEPTPEQSEGTGEYQVGDIVVYIYKGKTMDDWNALTDEDKANLEEKPASDVVNVKKIEKIEGDKFYFKDKDGNEFTKNIGDIIQKQTPPATESTEEVPAPDTEPSAEAPSENVTEGSSQKIFKFDSFFRK